MDGWLIEGVAANRAREGAETADNDSERAALERVEADERRHAKLGLQLASWATREAVTTNPLARPSATDVSI